MLLAVSAAPQVGAQESPGRPQLSREFIAVHKRRRIMDAIAELSAEQGYEATKIADIVKRAGVARKTLYDNFGGKEEVFLAAFDEAVTELLGQVEGACAATEGAWTNRVEAGLKALLGYFAERPAVAKMCMIEALAATPASSRRYEEAMARFALLVREAAPDNSGIPDTTEEILVGGVAWIVYQQVRRGETERSLELLPELTEFICAPYGR